MRKLAFSVISTSFFAIFLFVMFATPAKVAAYCFPTAGNTSSTPGDSLSLGDCLTLSNGTTVSSAYKTPADLINLLTANIFIFGGIILFGMIIYSGFLFITQGEKGMEQAKTTLTTAVLGFIIMFAAYWILRIIKIATGANILF